LAGRRHRRLVLFQQRLVARLEARAPVRAPDIDRVRAFQRGAKSGRDRHPPLSIHTDDVRAHKHAPKPSKCTYWQTWDDMGRGADRKSDKIRFPVSHRTAGQIAGGGLARSMASSRRSFLLGAAALSVAGSAHAKSLRADIAAIEAKLGGRL